MATNSATTARKNGTKKSSAQRASSGTARSNNKTAKRAVGGARSNATAPAGGVAAAQKVLRTVERREKTLRSALKRHKKTLKQLKKSTTAHRGTVEDLKTDLKKIAKSPSQSAPNCKSDAAGHLQSLTEAALGGSVCPLRQHRHRDPADDLKL